MATNVNTTHCPVGALADEVQRLINAMNVIDSKKDSPVIVDLDDGQAHEAILERLNAAIEWSSHLEAKSAKGALYQVLSIADMANLLLGYVGQEHDTDASKVASAIRRLAHSVAAYIESANDSIMLEDVGGSYYLNRKTSPHYHIELALMASNPESPPPCHEAPWG